MWGKNEGIDHLLEGLGRWVFSLEAFQDSGLTAQKSVLFAMVADGAIL